MKDDIRQNLLGAWRLVSWQEIHDDGSITYPLGQDAIGQLIYAPGDRVSAQLARTGQPQFESDDWQQATPSEMCAAWPSYFGYFGTFTLDPDKGAVTHHIEGGWFPNLVGTQQVRHLERFQDGRLVLHADTPWGVVRIIWEKLQNERR
jgi:Lipocalin-like domain